MEPDVLVIGAGPVGLTLACALLQHGVSVRVLDKAPGPATTSRANFVHARGSEVLDRLDALSGLPEQSVRAMTITTYAGDRPMTRIRFGDPGLNTAAAPMVISQARVEARLRDRLAELGVRPEWGSALVGVDRDADGVTAALGDGRTVRARWLAGCDGTGSTVRKLAGIGFPGVRVSERFLLVDAHLDTTLDRSGTSGWVHPEGMLGAMPMPGGEWRLLAYDPAFSGDKPTEEQIVERMRRILPERTGLAGIRLLDASWASLFSVHRRLADTYRQGRILLAGDAAHAHAPFGGQGMLTGIGDAENLAWKLALVIRGVAGDRLLDTYEAERRPLATQVLRGSTAATRVNIAAGPVGRFLRDRVMMPVFNLAVLQRWATYTTSQLWVGYRRGPLGGRGRRPRPGDRVPDVACERTDGTRTRLHAELRGRWAALGGDDLYEAARGRLGERVVHLRPVDPLPAMLVRPDAHLACTGDPNRWLDGALA
ncbi:Pentachlorophenol 4-monooxygenase [Nonomuraea coxensis DSM 45129]|uniref:Pentachlorophenol 4-monooxygenase n=1 Tax=Nonomuraea coxensis DSM 45129 TaxID=1122611 RepID=A0ABX8U304_9ACTN|nr:FAD-dependent oxidoreductase [Nonomuraea coxensis]QYC42122.1 Pentachlorophenol 4-monooxygenase [Nonomuraea coxensis DSM 45129]